MPIPIPCPKCGRELKLPDRSLLGRKGKCPKCGHLFVLEEPPIVALELAEPEPNPDVPNIEFTVKLRSEDIFGSASKQATSPGSRSEESKPDTPPAPPFAALGKPRTAPRSVEVPSTSDTSQPSALSQQAAVIPPAFDSLGGLEESEGTAARLKKLRKKNAKRRNIGIAITALIGVAIGAGVMFAPRSMIESPKEPTAEPTIAKTDDPVEEGLDHAAAPGSMLDFTSPTRGKPIDLKYIPFGAQVVLNLHPAELWKQNSLGEELRFCVPPIAKLIETTLSDNFQRKPEQVEELLICLIPGLRGNLPEVACVAHMMEDEQRSKLIDQLGQRTESYGSTVYVSGERAYMIIDTKTLAVCPKGLAQEMVQAMTEHLPADLIDPLLSLTDRDRHITAIFVPSTLTLQDMWFPENVRPFLRNSIEWLGLDVESVSWSVHLKEEQFFSEILLHNKGIPAKKLEKLFREKLNRLAETLVPSFLKMNPREEGKRMVIGRVPAMVEVFSLATISDFGPQHIQLLTSLPDRAAPNLALGTLLAWDESTRTDFMKEVAKPTPTETSKVPESIAERLKMKIDIDFRRTPFNEAFAFISGEISTPIEIDGDGLKLGGFTKNIAQEFKLDGTKAQDVIRRIFVESKGVDQPPDKTLVIIVDESKKKILVTTLAVAQSKGLTPFKLD